MIFLKKTYVWITWPPVWITCDDVKRLYDQVRLARLLVRENATKRTRKAIVASPCAAGAGEKSDTGGTTKGASKASGLAALNTSSGAAGTQLFRLGMILEFMPNF